MAYQLRMDDDGILWIVIEGDFDEQAAEASTREMEPFLTAATEAQPLRMLSDVRKAGKLSSKARRTIAAGGQDPRTGRNAVLGVSRYARVLVGFLSKASGQDNIRFFDSEAEALAWLKESG